MPRRRLQASPLSRLEPKWLRTVVVVVVVAAVVVVAVVSKVEVQANAMHMYGAPNVL